MSLINQMLQDLDIRKGSERQPVVSDLSPVAVKRRVPPLFVVSGMLLAAVLGSGVTWVLGQPKSDSSEGELIPLALPEPAASRRHSQNHRPPVAVLRAVTTEPPPPNAPDAAPLNPATRGPDQSGGSVADPRESSGNGQNEFARDRSIGPLRQPVGGQSSPGEGGSRTVVAEVTPQWPAAGGSLTSVKMEVAKGQPEQRTSVKAVTKPYRTSRPEEAAPGFFRDARFYLEQGRLADAEEALRRSLAADPTTSQARELLAALLLRGGRRSETALLLDQGLQLAPAQPVFISLRARLYREQGDTGKAIALLQQGLREDQDNGDLLALLGVLYQEEGRFSDAAAVYRRILKQRPGSANDWAGLAISLDAAGEQAAALQAYRRAMAGNRLSKEVDEYVRQRFGVLESQR